MRNRRRLGKRPFPRPPPRPGATLLSTGGARSTGKSEFYDNQRAIVESLERSGALRPGLDVSRATDILWTLNHPDLWQLLVGQRGWTPEQYEQWFGDTACAQTFSRDAA